jgi:hypothetical protein
VTAATDGDLQPVVACGAYGRLGVGSATTADDDRRTAVDEPVMKAPGIIVGSGIRQNNGAGDALAQRRDSRLWVGHLAS